MIDGIVTFVNSGFDARVYALCLAGFAAVSLIELRKASGLADFIRRLSHELAVFTMLAGIGLLILAMFRYEGHQVPATLAVITAVVLSVVPFLYLRVYAAKLNAQLGAAEQDQPVLRLPAPEKFTGRGDDR